LWGGGMANYLTLVKENNLDVLLQKEPKSKFLRTYLTQVLGTQELPHAESWEEWENWLSNNPPGAQTSRRQKPLRLQNCIPGGAVSMFKTRKVEIKGIAQLSKEFVFSFEDLVNWQKEELKTILVPLKRCRSLKSLAKVNQAEIQAQVEQLLLRYLEEKTQGIPRLTSTPLHIQEETVLEESIDTSNLSRYVETFVGNLYNEVRRRLEERQQANHR
jgi:hypothetical protein